MTVRRLASIALLCTVFAAGGASAATGLGAVLKGTPFQFFTEEDTKQFVDAARTLAETGKDGETARWANEASGSWGTLEIRRSFKRNATTPCKELRGENTARGRTEPFRLTTCRNAKGEWKIASSGPATTTAAAPKKPAPKTGEPTKTEGATPKAAEPAAKAPESTLPATVPESPPGGTDAN